MFYRMSSWATLALALLVGAPALVRAEAEEKTHDGKVVNISADKLVMATKDGKEHSHTVAADAKVTCDGNDCEPEDLKAGMKIRVTTKKDETSVATEIEAIDKNDTFADTHDGKLVSINRNKLVMTNKEGVEHLHKMAADATLTCDGKVCKPRDLKAGMRIRVTTKKDDADVVTGIDALDKDADFGQAPRRAARHQVSVSMNRRVLGSTRTRWLASPRTLCPCGWECIHRVT